MVITTGEDEYVRFWDISFKPVSEFSVRMHFPEAETDKSEELRKNLSIQSIDIFACKPPATLNSGGKMTTGYDKDNVRILTNYSPFFYYALEAEP